MKRFFKLLTAFLLTLLFAATMVDYYISWFYKHDDSEMFGRWNDIMQKKLDNDVIILGNCRATTGVNPMIIDSVLHVNSYNLGLKGSMINRQIFKYEVYEKFQGKQPKLIIQNIDYQSLTCNNTHYTQMFLPYVFTKGFRGYIKRYEHLNVFDLYVPCYRYYKTPNMVKAVFGFNKLQPNNTYKGYYGWGGDFTDYETSCDSIEYEHTGLALYYFQAFLEKLNKNGIKVVLVYPPLYHTLTERIVDIDNMRLMYDTIAKKYGAYILDYDTISICYDKTYFNDEGHLNTKCSEYYSLRLANDIKALDLLK